jgi:hypothetical protein
LLRGAFRGALKSFAAIEGYRVGDSAAAVLLVECATSLLGDLSQESQVRIEHGCSPLSCLVMRGLLIGLLSRPRVRSESTLRATRLGGFSSRRCGLPLAA